jgi:hypothetical protein
MTVKSNFMLKVEDAKTADIQKALQAAGIKVRSIQEIFKEEAQDKTAEKAGEKK